MSLEVALFKRNVSPIGLDIGAQRVRLIQLSCAGDIISVTAASEAAAAESNGDAPDAAARVRANQDTIRNLIRAGGFIGSSVVTAIPAGAARIKNFRLPCMPEEDLEDAVRFEAMERFQSLDERPEIRFFNAGRVEGNQGAQFELIVVAVRGDYIRAHLASLADAGLTSQAIDFAPAAAFRPFERFLKRAEDNEAVNAFLDVGQDSSRLLITTGTDISFLKPISVGGEAFETAIADALSIDREEAGRFLRSPGTDPNDENEGLGDVKKPAIMDALQQPIEALSKELALCLRYFSVTFRGMRVDTITCVGGLARNSSVLEGLTAATGTPIRAGNPLKNIGTDRVFTGGDRRLGQPHWATALGLALKGWSEISRSPALHREAVNA